MDILERNRLRMVAALERLATSDGMHASILDGVRLLRSGCSHSRIPFMYEPSIILVARGKKHGYVAGQHLVYDARNYLTLTVPVAFECETTVGADGPFLGIAVRIDLSIVSELLMQMESRPHLVVPPESTVSATPLDQPLSDAAVRLVETMLSPLEAKLLGPQIIREITYRVLMGRQGGALHSLLLSSRPRMQMHRVLHHMHEQYAKPMDVAELASGAGMSTSALHHHFKELTGTSPLQYLKAVRLHKARLLMLQDALGASAAAERVGYESASQFSREFKRLFGASPVEEVERFRASLQRTPMEARVS